MCVVLVRQIGTAQGHADAPTFVTRGRCASQTTRGNSLMRQAGTEALLAEDVGAELAGQLRDFVSRQPSLLQQLLVLLDQGFLVID